MRTFRFFRLCNTLASIILVLEKDAAVAGASDYQVANSTPASSVTDFSHFRQDVNKTVSRTDPSSEQEWGSIDQSRLTSPATPLGGGEESEDGGIDSLRTKCLAAMLVFAAIAIVFMVWTAVLCGKLFSQRGNKRLKVRRKEKKVARTRDQNSLWARPPPPSPSAEEQLSHFWVDTRISLKEDLQGGTGCPAQSTTPWVQPQVTEAQIAHFWCHRGPGQNNIHQADRTRLDRSASLRAQPGKREGQLSQLWSNGAVCLENGVCPDLDGALRVQPRVTQEEIAQFWCNKMAGPKRLHQENGGLETSRSCSAV
ncbi:uncharacterized protein LOC106706708 [Latimeria chalumnae]|uniref:uncharacterized protein LOC106706708 n=1 Tax=Latimeria chalumnae TaxID=7897 RepID=UPI00313DFE56